MKGLIKKKGIKLLLFSIVYRVVIFLVLGNSWAINSSYIRIAEAMLGVGFLSIWFTFGFKHRFAIVDAIKIAMIGTCDGILLSTVAYVHYINRGSYYFGPMELAVWGMPLFNLLDFIGVAGDLFLYLAPLIAVLLLIVGSLLGSARLPFQREYSSSEL